MAVKDCRRKKLFRFGPENRYFDLIYELLNLGPTEAHYKSFYEEQLVTWLFSVTCFSGFGRLIAKECQQESSSPIRSLLLKQVSLVLRVLHEV